MTEHVFYLVPHQDDELTNFGAAICADVSAGREVFCVLCTDGGASGARRLIGNGGGCAWHGGAHLHALSREDFSRARDREFIASCGALGVKAGNIVIPERRAADGSGDKETAKAILLDLLSKRTDGRVTVKALTPLSEGRQNRDHTATGLAAEELFAEGRFDELVLFWEMILLPAPESARLTKITPAPMERERLLKACAEYSLWDPGAGRYAVGLHSVYDEIKAFEKDPCAWVAG